MVSKRSREEPKDEIERRKDDHLALCAGDDVAFENKSTLLECVQLVHNSLPELAWDEVDTSVELFSKKLRYPIVIAGMTGGSDRAGAVNQDLARLAEERGYGFGVGSQRAMDRNQDVSWTYRVRNVAPNALVFGNIGAVQAKEMSPTQVEGLISAIDADALCIHLNPAMELIQQDGDRDFRGCLDAIIRLQRELAVEVIVKETGAGLSATTCSRLRDAGIEWVDVSGAGGTSWVGVEALRASGAAKALGEQFWDWGNPTAASLSWAKQTGLQTIATGGIRNGLDVARAIALGASVAGIARGFFMAQQKGADALELFADELEQSVRTTMLLTGSADIAALQKTPRVITGALRDWLDLESG